MTEHGRAFATLAEWSRVTGQEPHGIELDYDIFVRLSAPDPDAMKLAHATDLDFTLRPGSKAVDAGTLLPTINDDFTGNAPDLGALELGQPAPVYGPRWLKPGDIFYR